MSTPPKSTDNDWIDELLDKLGGQYITYRNRYSKEHHNFTHYQEDLRHASSEAKATLQNKIAEARIDELNKLEDWFQQYGYEMHVSHVCPQDNIDCAKFAGRTQKAHQVHKEILKLKAQLQGGDT
jgi:N-acetylglutamate synthase-like GNAT family acetyltransferase